MKPLAVAALVIVTAAAGAAAYLAFEQRARPPAAASVPAGSQPAEPSETGSPPPVLAERVPDFKLADRDGTMRSPADWQGKSLIVNFWATWCAPCRREIPLLGELQQQYGPAGFQVIGIAADYRDKVIAYADEAAIKYPLLIGEQEALDTAAAFGVEVVGFPFTVFSDSQGRVIACHVGELTRPQAEVILGAIERVNSGAASPDQARSEITAGIDRLKGQGGAQG
jgi:thiol-disulfide isomerase/thioredoxin